MAPLKNTLNMNVGLCHNSPCAGIRDSYYNGLVLNLMVINENEKSWSYIVKFNKNTLMLENNIPSGKSVTSR